MNEIIIIGGILLVFLILALNNVYKIVTGGHFKIKDENEEEWN